MDTNKYSYQLLGSDDTDRSIYDKIKSAFGYPESVSYTSCVYHVRKLNDYYRISLLGDLSLILLKNNPRFVEMYEKINKNCDLRFECVIKHPFATPEIINITSPYFNRTIDLIEMVIESPYVDGKKWDKRCEIILKNDKKNEYLGWNNNYEKYNKMIGSKCAILWYQTDYSKDRNVHDIKSAIENGENITTF